MTAQLKEAFFGARTVVVSCLFVFVLILGVSSVFGIQVLSPSVQPVKSESRDKALSKNTIEDVRQMSDEKWKAFSTKEKLNTLQVITNMEVEHLGLPHELNVITGSLSNHILGKYDDAKHLIIIDITHLEYDSPDKVFDSLFHENRHAYQHRLCDVYDAIEDDAQKNLLLLRYLYQMKEEFSNYSEADDDYLMYYLQKTEADARAYAHDAVKYYLNTESNN